MPGFNYNNKGDGTNWSSERGTGPEPGVGYSGTGGGSSGTSSSSKQNTPADRQLAAVGILGIILSALVGALINNDFIDRINNEIIRPAH